MLKILSQRRGVRDGEVAAAIFLAVGGAYWVALRYVDIQGSHPISNGSIYAAMAAHPRAYISALFGATHLKDALPVPFVWRVFTPGWSGRCRSALNPDSSLTFLVVQAWISGLAINRITGYNRDGVEPSAPGLTLALFCSGPSLSLSGCS